MVCPPKSIVLPSRYISLNLFDEVPKSYATSVSGTSDEVIVVILATLLAKVAGDNTDFTA